MSFSQQQVIPIFNGENYKFWSIKMKVVLQASPHLWNVVETGIPQNVATEATTTSTQASTQVDWPQRDAEALAKIHLAVTDTIFPRIMNVTSAKQAWDILKAEFEGNEKTTKIRLQNLRREFENLKMKDGEVIKDYSSRIIKLVNELKSNGDNITDQRVVEKILVSLSEKFDTMVTVIEESKDLTQLTISELIASLQIHEDRMSKRNETSGEGAFQSKHKASSFKQNKRGGAPRKCIPSNFKEFERKAKFSPCSICKKTNHAEKNCWYKGKTQCTYCKKFNHTEDECRVKNQQASRSETMEDENKLFYACQNSTNQKDAWLVDSGCTNHMTKHSHIFTEIDSSIKVPVRMGNGEMVKSEGKGTITIQTKKGAKHIKDVLYVPNLDQNLLSVPQMMQNGYSIHFEGDTCDIYDPEGNNIACIKMLQKCFPIQWQYKIQEKSMQAKTNELTWLWHKRFGHSNLQSLKFLSSKNMVKGLPLISETIGVCEGCQFGKMSRKSFPTGQAWRASKKLELVHTDVCGPMRTSSLDNSKYFILFIDDYSRMTWVYFLKEKSEVFNIFNKFKSHVEKESGCKIKCLRSDNGTEYTSSKFKAFCEVEGIHRQMTVPYTPQQNGVSERKNRTVMEMARSMLKDKNLPNKFWAEAVYTAVYLQNRLPTKAVNKRTPLKAWSGHRPSVSHLRIFGCICYIYVPSEKRHKLEGKAEKGIFLGYSSQSKGYRVYNPQNNKVQVSRDVVFDEDASWDWEHDDIKERYVVTQPINTEPTHEIVGQHEQHFQEESESTSDDPDSPRYEYDSFSDSPPTKTRRLSDIYENTDRIPDLNPEQVQFCYFVSDEPNNYERAAQHKEWRDAMKEEISMIEKNHTWVLVDKPPHKDTIGVKWVYKTKQHPDGSIQKYKARLVVKGYSQQFGVDYNETFAPVSRQDTIRAILALAAQRKWNIYQLDVKSAFLNGFLEEEIYIEQPPGFIIKGKEDKVLRLKKALYGLKQAPRAWYSRIDKYFHQQGFKKSPNEATLYIKVEGPDILILSLYVDDLIVTGSNLSMITKFKQQMMKMFKMTDLGLMNYFLGMEIDQSKEGIFICQERYARNILKKFNMEWCKPISTPLAQNEKLSKDDDSGEADSTRYRSIIGSLLYLTATRPDLMYATSVLSRFMQKPTQAHMKGVKRVLRYVKGTTNYGIWFNSTENPELIGYSDSDWAGSIDDMKSTSGYVFSLGNGVFSWLSQKQNTVAQSTAEVYSSMCSS